MAHDRVLIGILDTVRGLEGAQEFRDVHGIVRQRGIHR
jgi:hypothetical protein